jgi:integrase/recombinase XerD
VAGQPACRVFASRKGGSLTERAVNGMVKRTAAKAGINEAVSPHWLRHAHASHAIDRGASLPEVQTTLGHGNIATTSGYLHARPDTSSGLHLDPECSFDEEPGKVKHPRR